MSIQGALITGCAGFLGSHLAETLLKRGVPVIGVDNFCTSDGKNLQTLEGAATAKAPFHFFEVDVAKPWGSPGGLRDKIQKVAIPVSHVFHFASPASPPLYQEQAFETIWTNTLGLQEALQFANERSARVVFASTSEIYGDPLQHPQQESYRGNVNTMGPRSCYDEAKRLGETLIFTHNWKFATRHGLVRIFNTYGPRMNPHDGRVVVNFLLQAHRGEKLTVYGDGLQSRSFCYVSDLVDGILRYAQTDLTTPVNLGNDKEYTILELAKTVQNMFAQKKLLIEHFELPVDDPTKRRPALGLAKEYLGGWEPSVPLHDGLRLMYEWLKTQEAFL